VKGDSGKKKSRKIKENLRGDAHDHFGILADGCGNASDGQPRVHHRLSAGHVASGFQRAVLSTT